MIASGVLVLHVLCVRKNTKHKLRTILCSNILHTHTHTHTQTHKPCSNSTSAAYKRLLGPYTSHIRCGRTPFDMPGHLIAPLCGSVTACSTGPYGGICQLEPDKDAPTHPPGIIGERSEPSCRLNCYGSATVMLYVTRKSLPSFSLFTTMDTIL